MTIDKMKLDIFRSEDFVRGKGDCMTIPELTERRCKEIEKAAEELGYKAGKDHRHIVSILIEMAEWADANPKILPGDYRTMCDELAKALYDCWKTLNMNFTETNPIIKVYEAAAARALEEWEKMK